ncbi:MAG TPA: ABC transporter substrate-binding protein [Myxococcota bacterium]|nr:ABC transporter substrate-binding protein [Myxococcota bacterium]
MLRRVSWLALALALEGCTLSVKPADCTSNQECREAFGTGSVCGASGFCEVVTVPPRCTVWPEGALDAPSPDDPTLFLGAQYDYASDYIELLSTQLALQQANEREGLEGRSFALVACDTSEDASYDTLDPVEATRELSTFQADAIGAPAVIGAEYSSRAEAAYEILSDYGALVLSPGASSPSLITIDGATSTDAEPGLFWRTIPPDTEQGRVVSREIKNNLGGGQVDVIAAAGAYGEGFAQVFLQAYDPDATHTTLRLFADATDLSAAIVATGEAHPDVVLFISGLTADAVGFLNVAGTIPAFADIDLFLTDGAKTDELLTTVTPDGATLFPNVRGTFPRTPTGRPNYQLFASAFLLAFKGYDPNSDAYNAYCYDAGWLAAYGAAWSLLQEGDVTGVGMARGLRQISDGADVDIGPASWTTVKSSFRAGDGVDVSGASGSLDYDPETGETSAAIDIWFIGDDDGEPAFTVGYCWDLGSPPEAACTGSPP